jgi:signal transduction histidine kinase
VSILSLLKRPAVLASLAVVLLLASATGFFVYWRSPTRGLPYRDSFASAKAEEWTAFGGTWELSQGAMRNDSDERGAKLLTGSTRWRNYSIEADVMLLGLGGDAGLLIRSGNEEQGVDAYNGYYAGLRSIDNSLTLGRAGYGWTEVTFPLEQHGLRIDASHWYHLKLLAYGCQLVASAGTPQQPNTIIASITDENCLRSGRVGLRSYSAGGVWRNVVVRTASDRDLQEMLRLGRSQQTLTDESSASMLPSRGVSHGPPGDNQPHALPSSANTLPISSLRLVSLAGPRDATVRGIVILNSPALFVQDATGGVAVQPAKSQLLKVGDEVEVTGRVRENPFSSKLEDAAVRILWEATPMPAVSVTASQAATGAFDATFIEISGRLHSKEYGPGDELIFDFDSGPQSFRAIMNRGRGNYLYQKLKPNSIVRLSGVAVVDPAYTQSVTPFAVLVRSSDDVEILAGPPWWSARHLVAFAIGLLLFAFIINLLYHRIESMRLRAVVEEREHLAYEMHDTLAQSVAGIGFQLEAIRIGTPDELSKVHRQLDLATELVRHSHAEARRSISMLRPQEIESEGLLDALTNCGCRLIEGGSVKVVASSTGHARAISLRVQDTLYRIGQEALANAVRHAHPTTITIHLDYRDNARQMRISDDGFGFSDNEMTRGFGLQGMRKRASGISARLEVSSSQGRGTDVCVIAPLTPPVTFRSWPNLLWKFLREHTRHVPAVAKTNPHSYRR